MSGFLVYSLFKIQRDICSCFDCVNVSKQDDFPLQDRSLLSLISDPFRDFTLIASNEENRDSLRYIAVNGIGNFIARDIAYGQ